MKHHSIGVIQYMDGINAKRKKITGTKHHQLMYSIIDIQKQ